MSNESLTACRRGIGGGLVFVVAGPSGAGKNSVIDAVMERLSGLAFSVSYTSRAPRAGETDGEDYLFVSNEEFDRLVDEGEFLEHVTYSGNQYGTSRSQVLKAVAGGSDVILQIEVRGAQLIRSSGIAGCRVVYIFFTPSSLDLLGARLRGRGSETEAQIAARLAVAAEEINEIDRFEYLVINDDFDAAVNELAAIILAERSRITI